MSSPSAFPNDSDTTGRAAKRGANSREPPAALLYDQITRWGESDQVLVTCTKAAPLQTRLAAQPNRCNLWPPINRMNSNLLFGTTRTAIRSRHALIAPDGHVTSSLPGVIGATTVVLISPEMGAGFTELTITFNQDGRAEFPDSQIEAFVYVLAGSVTAQAKGERNILSTGEFVFVPAVTPWSLTEPGPGTQVHIFLKRYVALPGVPEPGVLFGREQDIASQPFLGDESARLQVLLPDNLSYDLAVNIFNYQAGAHLPFVETHIMEHGLLMLAGAGVYRLEDNWYPVAAGDCIWMAAFCPQWFVAMGKTPARYLYYKDINRFPAL